MNKKKNKKNSSLMAASVLVLCILIIMLMFLVKKDQIVSNLKETGFFDKIFGKTPEFIENHNPSVKDNSEKIELKSNEDVVIHINPEKDGNTEIIELKTTPASEQSENKSNIDKEKTSLESDNKIKTETVKKEAEKNKESVKVSEKTESVKTSAMMEVNLCFVEIDAEGSVVRKIAKRTVPKTDSPLTTTIGLLLKGPDITKSSEKNYMTLIPQGTKLLSAKVSNGVAYLNFNEAFEINNVGAEGYKGQLMQIVYTATAYSTVNSVQFLIEGQKVDYLGSEGQWIGSPLSKNSF